MKKQSTFVINQMSEEQLKELTNIVSETIAILPVEQKRFTSVDLWNIQRSFKSSFNRRNK